MGCRDVNGSVGNLEVFASSLFERIATKRVVGEFQGLIVEECSPEMTEKERPGMEGI